MSYVNLENNQIVDAKPNTLKWWHEMGHIEFNSSDKGTKVGYKQWFWGFMALTGIILGQFSRTLAYSSIAFILLSWFYFLYEEIWCWSYAFKNKKGGLKKDGLEKEGTSKQ